MNENGYTENDYELAPHLLEPLPSPRHDVRVGYYK